MSRIAEPPQPAPAEPGDCRSCKPRPRTPEGLNLFCGEFTETREDLRIEGRGLDFAWIRRYRSLGGPDTVQGRRWDFSYNVHVAMADDGLTLFDGHARSDHLVRLPDGTFGADGLLAAGRLTRDALVVTFADTGTWSFLPLDGRPAAGFIHRIQDRNGNALRFHYDDRGRLVIVQDSLDREIAVAYDAAGFIESVTDFAGRRVRYAYYRDGEAGGSHGDLKSVTTPAVVDTPNGNDFPSGKTTTYTYSTGAADERLDHLLVRITDPKGQVCLENVYATAPDANRVASGRIHRQIRGSDITDIAYVQESPGGATSAIVNDACGNVRQYVFDDLNRCVQVREFTGRARPDEPTTETRNRPSGKLRSADPEFFDTRYEWNVDSLPRRIIQPDGTTTEMTYDADIDPGAPRRLRGNLRQVRVMPGPLGGDPPEITRRFDYHPGFGCCCGSSFVARATDPRGHVTVNAFDERGNVVRTEHRRPTIVEEFSYNRFGQIVRHIHPDNGSGHRRIDEYVYHAETDGHRRGHLKAEIVDAGVLRLTTTYECDTLGRVVGIVEADGADHRFAWNSLDQLVRHESPEVAPQTRQRTDSWYDANDNLVRRGRSDGTAPADAGGASSLVTRDYDLANRCIRVSRAVRPGHEIVTEFAYDGNGNRTLVRRGEATSGRQPASAVRLQYDERDMLFRRIQSLDDDRQITTQFDYDAARNRVRLVVGLEAEIPSVFATAYDSYGRMVRMIDPLGALSECRYDANDNQVWLRITGAVTPEGRKVARLYEAAFEFDEMDRPVTTEIHCFDPVSQEDLGTGRSVRHTTYADTSAPLSVMDAGGGVTHFVYDTAHRLRARRDGTGHGHAYSYDAGSHIIRIDELLAHEGPDADARLVQAYAYDALGRVTRAVDGCGDAREYVYDDRDNCVAIHEQGRATHLDYDGLNRVTSVTRSENGRDPAGVRPGEITIGLTWDDSSRLVERIDPNGNVTRYAYDGTDRLLSTTYADGTQESYVYDAQGNCRIATDASGTVITSTYDRLGRQIRCAVRPGPGVGAETTHEEYAYDGLSRLLHAANDASTLTRRYDSLSRVLEEDLDDHRTVSSYEGDGGRSRCTYPSGREVVWTRDSSGRVVSISDQRGVLAMYRYERSGNPSSRERPRSGSAPMVTCYARDGAGRITHVSHVDAQTGELIAERRCRWDSSGNKVRDVDGFDGGPLTIRDYGHDSVNRLRQSVVKHGEAGIVRRSEYGLDAAGNRTSVITLAGAETYDMDATLPRPADRQMNRYTATPLGHCRYDGNGNLVSISNTDGPTRTMRYDARNRMVEHVDRLSGTTVRYTYDCLGRRIATRVEGETPRITRSCYDGEQLIEERDDDGAVLATYVYGLHLTDMLSMRRGADDFHYHADDLGSVRAMTDGAGRVLERYDYDDFGEPLYLNPDGQATPASVVGNPYLFTGHRFDTETGLYHCGTRYYAARLGRFTTRDRIGIWEDARNLGNGYTYGANNPHTFVDPRGESVTRHISCSGGWPAPRVVDIYYEGCSKSRRQSLDNPVCRAFRAAGRAFDDVQNLWMFDLLGMSFPSMTGTSTGTTRQRVKTWFGGPDNATSTSSKQIISGNIFEVFEAFNDNDVDIDCEGGCPSGKTAYVNWGGSDVNLCNLFFTGGFSASKQAAILLHELTHAYPGTEDYFYYPNDGSNAPWNAFMETPTLRDNGDTYEQFVLQFYT